MSLVWSDRKPVRAGFYWLQPLGARPVRVVEVMATPRGLWVRDEAPLEFMVGGLKWAGPIAAPREPKPGELAVVRHKLSGTYRQPSQAVYWDDFEWSTEPREVIEWRALRASEHSSEVYIHTSRKRNGRWCTEPRERWVPKQTLPAGGIPAGVVGQHGGAVVTGAPVTATAEAVAR